MKISLLSTLSLKHRPEATRLTIISLARELREQGHEVEINKVSTDTDIIHSFSAAPINFLKFYLRRNKKAKLIHTLKSYSRRDFLRFKFARLLNKADAITVPTKIFKNKLTKKGVSPEIISVINSHFDSQKFKLMNKKELKVKYGLRNKRVILYYGATWSGKGVQYLLKAIPYVIRDTPEADFIILSRHKLDAMKNQKLEQVDELKKLINLYRKNITFTEGTVNKIEEYVNLADVVVLPYKDLIATEGNPSCLLEAMACKTPIVTSNLPELREIVEPEKDALMTEPGDVIVLAKNINRILNDKKLAEKLAENAYKKSKEFDVRKIAKQFMKLYRTVLNGS